MTKEDPTTDIENGYVTYKNRLYKKEALRDLKPDLFSSDELANKFGVKFPKYAKRGQIFVRVDITPNRIFKFDGNRWIEISKEQSSSYLDDQYVEFLIAKIGTGEADLDMLTDDERSRISEYLTNR